MKYMFFIVIFNKKNGKLIQVKNAYFTKVIQYFFSTFTNLT